MEDATDCSLIDIYQILMKSPIFLNIMWKIIKHISVINRILSLIYIFFCIENDILKEKMNKFAKICVFSDSEDETNESIKNLKKNILINFKNFLKQNRSQMQPIKP